MVLACPVSWECSLKDHGELRLEEGKELAEVLRLCWSRVFADAPTAAEAGRRVLATALI